MRFVRPLVLLAVAVALALAASACGGKSSSSSGKVPAGDVAVVKGEPITLDQLNRLLDRARRSYKAQKRQFPKAGTVEYQRLAGEAVQFLVQRVEFAQEAGKRGVTVTAKDIDDRLKQIKKQYFGGSEKRYQKALKQQGITDAEVRDDIKAQLISEKLYKAVTKGITVTDAEVKAYYDQHPQQYTQPESRDVRHILVKQKSLADTIYTRLCGKTLPCLKAKADFAALAKKYSLDPSSKNNGGNYTAVRGQSVPEFDKVAFELKTHEISKPVHTQYGWHVIQALTNIRPRKSTPYKQVKAAIKQQLLSQKQSAAQQAFLDNLKKEYEGKVFYAKGYEPPATTTATTTGAATTTG
jgi:parvulin-like peptidyl-prolyl isomerase